VHRRPRDKRKRSPSGLFHLALAVLVLAALSTARADTPYGYPAAGAMAAAKSGVIQAGGPVFLHGCLILNVGSGTDYVQFFDSATVPADNAVPTIAPIKLGAGVGTGWDAGASGARQFNAGAAWACSSTAATKTLCGASDILISCQYN
jgi:hypothetical protein